MTALGSGSPYALTLEGHTTENEPGGAMAGRSRRKREQENRRQKPQGSIKSPPPQPTKADGSGASVLRLPRRTVEITVCALAVLGVVADISGIVGTPSIVQLVVGVVALTTGLALRTSKTPWTALKSKTPTAIAAIIAGALIASAGLIGVIRDHNKEQRTAKKGTCGAAQDYYDAYLSSSAQWAVTGLRTAESDQADAITAASLDLLSQAANQSGDPQLKDLVFQVRTNANVSLAQGTPDTAASIRSLRESMEKLSSIFDICSASGYVIDRRRPPIEPTLEKACSYFNDFSFPINKDDPVDVFSRKKWANFTMFLYHGLNVNDTAFATDVENYIQDADKETMQGDGMALIARDCDAHGYKTRMKLLSDLWVEVGKHYK